MSNASFAIDQVNDLIQITRDRIKGYEKAIEETGSKADVAGVFRQHDQEARQMLTDLTQVVSQMGGTPAKEGTVLGTLHRSWMEVKNAFTTEDTESVLENCVFGDKAALKAYDEVLDDSKDKQIPSFVRETLTKQRRSVELSLDHMKQLEEVYDALDD